MNYHNNKKFGLLQFHSGYGTFYLNSPKGYSRKIINAQTGSYLNTQLFASPQFKYKLTLALKVHFSSRNTAHLIKNSFFHGVGSFAPI